jgi:hypothetical protein
MSEITVAFDISPHLTASELADFVPPLQGLAGHSISRALANVSNRLRAGLQS